MDLRLRLLLAFSPLMIFLLGLIAGLPIIQRQAEVIISRQILANNDLIAGQEFEIIVLLEHDAVGHIAEGSGSSNLLRFQAIRARAEALIESQRGVVGVSQEVETQIAILYAALAEQHDAVVAAAVAGDLAAARDTFEAPFVDATLDSLLALSQQARELNRREIELINLSARENEQRLFLVLSGAFAVGILIAAGLSWLLLRQIVANLEQLTSDAEQFAAGAAHGQLRATGKITQIQRLRDAFQILIDTNAQRQIQLQQTLTDLEGRITKEAELNRTIRALSVAAVPLAKDTLLLPLFGHLDAQRANEVRDRLLAAVHQQRTKLVVLDLNGLAVIDNESATALQQIIQAIRLLGCRAVLVGVRADQALPMLAAGVQRGTVEIARDIPSVLAHTAALRQPI
jgi:anti-anti-sigma regulatory factor